MPGYQQLDGRITFDQLKRDDTGDVWVVNNSGNVYEQSGVINIPINTEDNDQLMLIIPNTWIPINVSEMFPKEEIMKSSSFRSLLSKNVLNIISPNYAREQYKKRDVLEEYDRIKASAVQYVSNKNTTNVDEDPIYHSAVTEIVERDDISENQAISLLKRNEREIDKNSSNYKFLLERSSSDRVKAYAKEKLENL